MEVSNETKAKNAINWIEQLSKTKVKQGYTQLGDAETGYCCLGFACTLFHIPYDPAECYNKQLPDNIGLYTYRGDFYDSGGRISAQMYDFWSLADVNDSKKYTFSEISDLILTNIDLVFIPTVAKIIKDKLDVKN